LITDDAAARRVLEMASRWPSWWRAWWHLSYGIEPILIPSNQV